MRPIAFDFNPLPPLDLLCRLLQYDKSTGIFTRKTRVNKQMEGSVAGSKTKKGYRVITIAGTAYRAHRIAWVMAYGKDPSGQIDHINGKRDDNRLENLRDVDARCNAQNRHGATSNGTSVFLGVSFRRETSTWVAQIRINGKPTYLGAFETEEEAHSAYLHQKRIHHAGCTI